MSDGRCLDCGEMSLEQYGRRCLDCAIETLAGKLDETEARAERAEARCRQLEGQRDSALEQAIAMGDQWRACLPARRLAEALTDFLSDTPGLHWIIRNLGNADKRTRLLATFSEYGRP